MYVVPFWPAGTVFVSVVDPGVGTPRRASVAKLKNGCYVVTPDNGTLTHMYYKVGIEAIREIDENVNRLKGTEGTSIFHGRDLFAYCAGKLAAGVIDFEGVGPEYPVSEVVLHDTLFNPHVQSGCAEGVITEAMKHFGNLNTNIPIEAFNAAGFSFGDMVHVTISHEGKAYFDQDVLYQKSFGFVGKGEPIVFNGSMLYVGIALNQGHFTNTYAIGDGETWKVRITKA
jgi:S-adenosylmethionine hydrolase